MCKNYIRNGLIKGFVMRCNAPVNPNNNYFKTVFFFLTFESFDRISGSLFRFDLQFFYFIFSTTAL